jgi:hypothetical protein
VGWELWERSCGNGGYDGGVVEMVGHGGSVDALALVDGQLGSE